MDGYIKNKTDTIKSIRKTILAKYSITFLIIILIIFWLLVLVVNQLPEKWTNTEIVFSHISQERVGFQRGRSYVLNTKDGKKFVINSKYVDVTNLSENLVPGNIYFLVFSDSGTIAGGKIVEALHDENLAFQNLGDSISRWKNEQQEIVVAIIVTLIIEVAALILIDRLWCKKEYSQIQKLKVDIKRREDLIANK